jgi:hypothetical protein
MGMELLDQPDLNAFRRKHDIPGKYLLYAGRIDAGKGLEELFRYFQFFKEEHPGSGNLQLILIGRLAMKLPQDPSIRYIGFVDEGDKLSAMAGAVAVLQPSRMESLSIVTLEAFSVGTPVIVNGQSRVLADHCRKANAGLYYGDFEEFEEVLNLLLADRNLGRMLGRNGQTYVKDNYGWNRLLPKYEMVFRSSARPAKEPRSVRGRALAPPLPPAPEEREQPEQPEQEERIATEELPLLEPLPDGEPSEAREEEMAAEEFEAAVLREEYEEPAPREPEYEEPEYVEPAPPRETEERETPEEESYAESPEESNEARADEGSESSPSEEEGLPEFYRPRRPLPKMPEPSKEE